MLASVEPSHPRAIIVLGMHRSGTSAFSGMLQLLGVDMGPSLVAAKEANAAGYWEHQDIVNAHEQLLVALHSSWDDYRNLPHEWWKAEKAAPFRSHISDILARDFSGRPVWGIKDPRMCRLLPLWHDLLADIASPFYILVVRHPLETVRSLEKRDGFSTEKSQLLWLRHTLDAEIHTRGRERAIVIFDEFLSDPIATLRKVQQAMGQEWPISIETASADLERFADPGKRHHRVDSGQPSGLSPWLIDAFDAMRRGASAGDEAMVSAIDPVHRTLREAAAIYEPLMAAQEPELHRQLDRLQEEFAVRLSQTRTELHAQFQESRRSLRAKNGELLRLQKSWPGKLAKLFRRKRRISPMRLDFPTFPTAEMSIVVTFRDGFQELARCLRSLRENPPSIPFEVVLVDDGSEGLLEDFMDVSGPVYLRNEVERGSAASLNRGAQHARGTDLVFVAAQAELAAAELDNLRSAVHKNAESSLAGRVLPPDKIDPALATVSFCEGVCVVPKNLFLSFGGFDRRYRSQTFANADFALKLRQAGRDVHLSEIPSPVSSKKGPLHDREEEESRRRFTTRWKDVLK